MRPNENVGFKQKNLICFKLEIEWKMKTEYKFNFN